MTYSEAFPLWVAEVYRNHGYEPDKWYGSEVAETLYNEAMATFSSGVWRIFIEQEGSAPHRHKVCQETNEDDYSDVFYTEADVVRHEIASARN